MIFRSQSVIGIVAATIFFIILLVSADAQALSLLWSPFSFLLVFGGTSIASFLSHQNVSFSQFFHSLQGFFMDDPSTRQACKAFLRLSSQVQAKNLREVEDEVKKLKIPFLRAGLQLVVDRAPSDDIVKVLSIRINRAQEYGQMEANVFHSAATYAPAFGMLGTLIGLLGVLGNIGSGDLSQIGIQMAIALVTTFYGILLANLVFRPMAVQLERRVEHQVFVMKVLAECVLFLNMGKSAGEIKSLVLDLTDFKEDELSEQAA